MEKMKFEATATSMQEQPEDIRTGLSPETLKRAIVDNLFYVQGRLPESATRNDWYMALAYAVRDRLLDRWITTVRTFMKDDVKVVGYLSAEFLMGPHLENNLINLGIYQQAGEAVSDLGLDLRDLIGQEEEPGLGNGGLGRLAACYLDSMATLQIPSIGYGIRYEFGIFDQQIREGWQVEVTDKWLNMGNPWEIPRPDIGHYVNFGGSTEHYQDHQGRYRVRWVPNRVIKGIAYDTPVLGYRANTTNLLRLWKAEAVESFDFEAFNTGDYYGAVNAKIYSENITKVLYPNDSFSQGRQLRLEQQYFFTSCSLQDMLRIHLDAESPLEKFQHYFAVQLNDTHPSIAVAELMRLLVDEHLMEWEQAWEITQQTIGYTNHTLLPEALEKWPLQLFARLLPRHLEIIYEINRRFLDEVRSKYPGDEALAARVSLIDEAGEKAVRMAHLASLGSHAINGVAALHTELLKHGVLRDFYQLFPEKFLNITNGVTPRRWVLLSNPALSKLISDHIGDEWVRNTEEELRHLEAFVEDSGFRHDWRRVKSGNKQNLARLIKEQTGILVDPDSLFDIQVKRFHEYKRQHLNVLHVITLYLQLKNESRTDLIPRTVVFGGKAAPGYVMAKLIIKLINSVADVINNDPAVADRLKVIFMPDFNVKNGQLIYPAADLSEQISTAGKEASGTGNMKFALNGALTIGTLDGANIEIRETVGYDNFFLFGLTADQVAELKLRGYNPSDYYTANARLREVIDLIGLGFFSKGDRDLFKPFVNSLLSLDEYMVMADYQAYLDCQAEVGQVYRDPERWTRMSIFNVARMGNFSSDRSILEYCHKIWHVKPVKVEVD
ncbi:MAG TPA: glycogen/starch/alpha-glucan phosphorylase [Blastocatellia bacterium]|nr:glycogen/starch/alpha-glucan phosphorylase [Blastocatellia bacterium]